jgi:hypothetical protein
MWRANAAGTMIQRQFYAGTQYRAFMQFSGWLVLEIVCSCIFAIGYICDNSFCTRGLWQSHDPSDGVCQTGVDVEQI